MRGNLNWIYQRPALRAGLFSFCLLLASCASYQSQIWESRSLLSQGRFEEALAFLEKKSQEESGDRLVYLLDYATALQMAGRWEDSNKAFLEADRLAEISDYHSVSRVAGSLLLNEEMKQYKGDTFEKIMINAQLALNFLALGDLDSALVEARRINEKFIKLRAEDKQAFELNPFAKYLSAVAWEADKKYDDAAIAYTETYRLSPSQAFLPEDLLRSTRLARRPQEHKKWKEAFPHIKEDNNRSTELIVFVQQGWGARKEYDPFDATFPRLRPVSTRTQSVRVEIDGQVQGQSRLIYDVDEAAIKTLADDRAALVARRLAGYVAKEAAAEELRRKNELLGTLAWVAMHASDRADLRQWSTLPSSIHMLRLPLKPGLAQVTLQGVDEWGLPTADRWETQVDLKPGRKSFLQWRTLR